MKDFLQAVLPSQKQWWLYSLSPFLMTGVIVAHQESFQFYFGKVFPYLQQDKAVGVLGIATLWFLTSTYLLKYEKDKETKQLKSKIESIEGSMKLVTNTVIQKNKQIEELQRQLNMKQVLKDGQNKLKELAEVKIKPIL